MIHYELSIGNDTLPYMLSTSIDSVLSQSKIFSEFYDKSASITDKEAGGRTVRNNCCKLLGKTPEEDQEEKATIRCEQLLRLKRLVWVLL